MNLSLGPVLEYMFTAWKSQESTYFLLNIDFFSEKKLN
jgi:hypothetical protein